MNWGSRPLRRAARKRKDGWNDCSARCKTAWSACCGWRGRRTRRKRTAACPTFSRDFNARFMVPAAEEGACYRAMEAGTDLDTLFCFKYQRTVGMDNTVRFGGERLQLLPGPRRRSWARASVEVQERLDGSWPSTITGSAWRRRPHRRKHRCCGHAADAGGAQQRRTRPCRARPAHHCDANGRSAAVGESETGSDASVEARLPTAGDKITEQLE